MMKRGKELQERKYADASITDLGENGILLSVKETGKQIVIPRKYLDSAEFCNDADWKKAIISKKKMVNHGCPARWSCKNVNKRFCDVADVHGRCMHYEEKGEKGDTKQL